MQCTRTCTCMGHLTTFTRKLCQDWSFVAYIHACSIRLHVNIVHVHVQSLHSYTWVFDSKPGYSTCRSIILFFLCTLAVTIHLYHHNIPQDLWDGAKIGHPCQVPSPVLRGTNLVRCQELHPGAQELWQQGDFPSVVPPRGDEGDAVLFLQLDKVKRGQWLLDEYMYKCINVCKMWNVTVHCIDGPSTHPAVILQCMCTFTCTGVYTSC